MAGSPTPTSGLHHIHCHDLRAQCACNGPRLTATSPPTFRATKRSKLTPLLQRHLVLLTPSSNPCPTHWKCPPPPAKRQRHHYRPEIHLPHVGDAPASCDGIRITNTAPPAPKSTCHVLVMPPPLTMAFESPTPPLLPSNPHAMCLRCPRLSRWHLNRPCRPSRPQIRALRI